MLCSNITHKRTCTVFGQNTIRHYSKAAIQMTVLSFISNILNTLFILTGLALFVESCNFADKDDQAGYQSTHPASDD